MSMQRMGQKMKAIYFRDNFEITVNEIEIKHHSTFLFTTLEEYSKIRATQRQLIEDATKLKGLLAAVTELDKAGKLNKGLKEKLGRWL